MDTVQKEICPDEALRDELFTELERRYGTGFALDLIGKYTLHAYKTAKRAA